MNILSIGDVHGIDKWQIHTHNTNGDYMMWESCVKAGADPLDKMWADMPYMKYDKIIFVGDYVDSFTLSNSTILYNLQQIIFFKKVFPDKVVLLLGNHDIQYIVHEKYYTGYRATMLHDLYDIFSKNMELFQMAYQYKDHIWTHAGISLSWFTNLREKLESENYRFSSIVKEYNPKEISDYVNLAWDLKDSYLFCVDAASGGIDDNAGPLWIRPTQLNSDPIRGMSQIVGHTMMSDILVKEVADCKHYFIDCLPRNSVLKISL